jgi:hypothetical protein
VGFIPKNLSLDTAPLCGSGAPGDFSLETSLRQATLRWKFFFILRK